MNEYAHFYLKELTTMIDQGLLDYISGLFGTELLPLEINNRIRGAIELATKLRESLAKGAETT